jgi:hypothetical protein
MINENNIATDPSASKWLKDLIEETKSRDVVDTINELEVLMIILTQRYENQLDLNT